ncbi:hypothetical protein HF086_007298 [Spodoptera exigua]|uniref:Uncharacterized protein n=1 Tax=Spodoptera exigua TaxID=7107 RepID=A0A922SJN2_SPOEX|nr:hypothetical protein HF086_007298 [Spodoptera exigua]
MSQPLKVWSKFSVTKKDGSVLNLRIVDMPEDVKETMFIIGVPESAEAMEELKGSVGHMVTNEKPVFSICCLDNGKDEIDELNFETKELQKLIEMSDGLSEIYDDLKEFNLDPYLLDRGIVVCPEYRGLGIAQELLKVRRLISKEFGIPINGAWMTSYGTQKAAERDGWETVCEIQYEDLEKKFNVTYGRNPPSSKFMIARIPL